MSTALIIVDVQRDFLPGGALAVPDGHQVIPVLEDFSSLLAIDHVVLTRDWHPANHMSFSDDPEFVDGSWPSHCVQNTPGADIDHHLDKFVRVAPWFSKGTNPTVEAYSGFDGVSDSGGSLLEYLRGCEVETVYIGGLALDYCVKATALDAVEYGFETIVLIDGTRPVTYETGLQAAVEMADAGVVFVRA